MGGISTIFCIYGIFFPHHLLEKPTNPKQTYISEMWDLYIYPLFCFIFLSTHIQYLYRHNISSSWLCKDHIFQWIIGALRQKNTLNNSIFFVYGMIGIFLPPTIYWRNPQSERTLTHNPSIDLTLRGSFFWVNLSGTTLGQKNTN